MTISKVCILAAGTGSRLGSLTNEINKCLLPLGNSTALTLIIEQFPRDSEIIIAVGYKSELVRDYCAAVHGNRNIICVDVDPYEGVGAGPGYSLKCCEPFLKSPFYLTTGDCLVTEEIPILEQSWIGVCDNDYSGLYSTARVDEKGIVKAFQNKSKNDYEQAFIGLAYIHNPDVFWSELELKKGSDKEYEFVSAWYSPEKYNPLLAIPFTWMDTGCAKGYEQTKDYFTAEPLGMKKRIMELTVKVNNILCKLCPDTTKNINRIIRGNLLYPHTPRLIYGGEYACAWEWIEGSTLYDCDSVDVYFKLLDWCQKNIWSDIYELPLFDKDCQLFYHDKTIQRYQMYIDKNEDNHKFINDQSCHSVGHYLHCMPWEKFTKGIAVLFHGDLQYQNVIYDKYGNYKLIDWRESFGTRNDYGDLYYDLAKLYGGVLLPYSRINDVSETFLENSDGCTYIIDRSKALSDLQPMFEEWVVNQGYDLERVKLLTALVWLNMAPLHVEPVDVFLFTHAQWMLASLFGKT